MHDIEPIKTGFRALPEEQRELLEDSAIDIYINEHKRKGEAAALKAWLHVWEQINNSYNE